MVPMLTILDKNYRIDVGGEVRFYSGDHFGEATQFSDPSLNAKFNNNWYRYYQYLGNKNILTAFTRFIWSPSNQPFTVSFDLQNQNINWDLDQKKNWPCSWIPVICRLEFFQSQNRISMAIE